MATATRQDQAGRHQDRGATAESESAAIEFLVFEDNGGDYRWTIIGDGDQTLTGSGAFGSYDDAEQVARMVRDGAGSARFERRPPAVRPAVLARHGEAT